MLNQKLLNQIQQLLLELGMSPTLLGYRHLAQCIYICVLDDRKLHNLIAEVYGEVAEINGTTEQRVERNIRHAIYVFAARNHVPDLNRLLKAKIFRAGDYPSNGEMIGYLTEYFLIHYDFDADVLVR